MKKFSIVGLVMLLTATAAMASGGVEGGLDSAATESLGAFLKSILDHDWFKLGWYVGLIGMGVIMIGKNNGIIFGETFDLKKCIGGSILILLGFSFTVIKDKAVSIIDTASN